MTLRGETLAPSLEQVNGSGRCERLTICWQIHRSLRNEENVEKLMAYAAAEFSVGL
jgi:hypothetical protein